MRNLGVLDRFLRLLSGIVLLVVLVQVDSWWRYIGLLGFVFLWTALSGECYVYRWFGISTRQADKKVSEG